MKLAFVDLCGFRGYRNRTRIEFADGFTVIDGRNGAGKSTIFDAIEFALTGTIAKYGGAKSDGESVKDYLWWSAPGITPPSRFVEVGFVDAEGRAFSVRRTDTTGEQGDGLLELLPLLCDSATMPKEPLSQLCDVSIVRDERIAELSLDLKETDRYTRVHEAIGATDSEVWIGRASRLAAHAKRRVEAARKDAELCVGKVDVAQRRVDEVRASQLDAQLIAAATKRLQDMMSTNAAADELLAPARDFLAKEASTIGSIDKVLRTWDAAENAQIEATRLQSEVAMAQAAVTSRTEIAEKLATRTSDPSEQSLNKIARDLAALIALGRQTGLLEDRCPLCSHQQDAETFEAGIKIAESIVLRLDAQALEEEAVESARRVAAEELASARARLEEVGSQLLQHVQTIASFTRALSESGIASPPARTDVENRRRVHAERVATAEKDISVLESLRLSTALERALHEHRSAKDEYASAEKRLGLARRAESRAQALHDAARRAAGETVDRRIERVLPLLSELYRRLRPHPTWDNIEYKIRGDVRRFMKLSVGDEKNPQFMFSSGQRRATGLAFLLSVNLSLAWSRWHSIMLDDPVQHIDDFRSIQLTEVLAQIGTRGRQIVCAVEDEALADMMCRRLPVDGVGSGKRVTLGTGADGALTILRDESLVPMPQRTFVRAPDSRVG